MVQHWSSQPTRLPCEAFQGFVSRPWWTSVQSRFETAEHSYSYLPAHVWRWFHCRRLSALRLPPLCREPPWVSPPSSSISHWRHCQPDMWSGAVRTRETIRGVLLHVPGVWNWVETCTYTCAYVINSAYVCVCCCARAFVCVRADDTAMHPEKLNDLLTSSIKLNTTLMLLVSAVTAWYIKRQVHKHTSINSWKILYLLYIRSDTYFHVIFLVSVMSPYH